MARKLENYSLDILVLAFCTKWNLRLYDIEVEKAEPPCVVLISKSKKRSYNILFVNSLSPNSYHTDTLTKKKIIHPEEHFAFFQLDQLEKSREKESQEIPEKVSA